jgi:hypothetical protein
MLELNLYMVYMLSFSHMVNSLSELIWSLEQIRQNTLLEGQYTKLRDLQNSLASD